MSNKCKGCPYANNHDCNGDGFYWSECYENKKHKDFMDLLDKVDREKRDYNE